MMGSKATKVTSIVYGVMLVAYPVAAYFALKHFSVRTASACLLVLFVPAAFARLGSSARRAFAPLALLPLVTVALLFTSAVVGAAELALLVPVATNASLLVAFAVTLVRGPPLVERFARLRVDDLSATELRWCAGWTWGWSAFFLVNGAIAFALSFQPTLEAWTTYNGLIAYLLIGTMFGVEYSIRKYRFGRLGTHVLDRGLARVFALLRPSGKGETP